MLTQTGLASLIEKTFETFHLSTDCSLQLLYLFKSTTDIICWLSVAGDARIVHRHYSFFLPSQPLSHADGIEQGVYSRRRSEFNRGACLEVQRDYV